MDYATFIEMSEPRVIAYFDQVLAAFCEHWPERDAAFWKEYILRVLAYKLGERECPPTPAALGMDWDGGW